MAKVLRGFSLFIYYVLSSIFLEIITFRLLGLGFLPQYFMYDFVILFGIAIFVMLIPNHIAQYIIYTLLLVLQIVFLYLNYSLLTIYGDLFSIEMPAYISEAAEAITSNFVYLTVIIQLISLLVLDIILGFWILRHLRKNKIDIKRHVSAIISAIIIGAEVLSCGFVVLRRNYIENSATIEDSNYIETDSFLIKTSYLKLPSYRAFGTFGYVTNMIVNSISKVEDGIKAQAVQYFKSGSIYATDENDSRLYDDENNELARITGVDSGNNIIMIMMESAEWLAFSDGNYDKEINNLSYELTPNIYYLAYGADYVDSGDNQAKTGDLSDNGIIFSNYFAKSKTNFSEIIGILGEYPVGRVLTDVTKNVKKTPSALGYSLPNMLKNSNYNYYTSYIHSNVLSFYNRDKSHANLGFDNVVGKESITNDDGSKKYTGKDLDWNHWTEESQIVLDTMEYLIPSEETLNGRPFFTFYLNVCSHGPYMDISTKEDYVKYKALVMYGEENCELVDNIYRLKPELDPVSSYSNWYSNILLNYKNVDASLVEELVCYQASMVGLDRAIGVIIDELQSRIYTSGPKANQTYFDNTTIVLYSDHYSYYNNLSNRFKGIDNQDYSSIELQTIPMIISSPGIRGLNKCLIETGNEEYCLTKNFGFHTHYDLIPTILDLLGIEFNENFYLGSSVFAPAKSSSVYGQGGEFYEMKLFYSNTGGIFSKDIYTYDMRNFVYDENIVTSAVIEIFKSEAAQILKRINCLDIINEYGLYSKCIE